VIADAVLRFLPPRNRNQYFQMREQSDMLELVDPSAPARANVLVDSPTPRDSPIFIRGQAESHGDSVPRRFFEVLSGSNRSTWQNTRTRCCSLTRLPSCADPAPAIERRQRRRRPARARGPAFARSASADRPGGEALESRNERAVSARASRTKRDLAACFPEEPSRVRERLGSLRAKPSDQCFCRGPVLDENVWFNNVERIASERSRKRPYHSPTL
jgi:hypothetical protein